MKPAKSSRVPCLRMSKRDHVLPEQAAPTATGWLADLLQGLVRKEPQVLITVLRAQGSTPRNPGARMWVHPGGIADTIGGGHLEWKAIAHAKEMLKKGKRSREVLRFPLGPSLGQCCGGVVWLSFECLTHDDVAWCRTLLASLEGGHGVRRSLSMAGDSAPHLDLLSHGANMTGDWDPGSGQWADIWTVPSLDVVVCGAGHVGRAIVRLLGDLPVRVVWLDPRPDCWPADVPANVRVLQGDADDVRDMPDGACWLVLTHSHALDLQIIEAVLQHRSFRFLGLIGSRSKRARFESRLCRRFPEALVQRIQCPIGLADTSSKLPAAIAVSTVAQLLAFIPA